MACNFLTPLAPTTSKDAVWSPTSLPAGKTAQQHLSMSRPLPCSVHPPLSNNTQYASLMSSLCGALTGLNGGARAHLHHTSCSDNSSGLAAVHLSVCSQGVASKATPWQAKQRAREPAIFHFFPHTMVQPLHTPACREAERYLHRAHICNNAPETCLIIVGWILCTITPTDRTQPLPI